MTTKRQHFVPRFYLRHFTNDEGKFRAYRRAIGSYFTTAPENLCVENYLYDAKQIAHAKEEDKYLSNYIDNKLAAAEGRLVPLFNQLIDCCEKRDFRTDKYHEGRLAACILAASLIVRHPCTLNQERDKSKELLKSMLYNATEQELDWLEHEGRRDYLEAICEIAIMWALLFSEESSTPLMHIYNSFAGMKMTVIQAPAEMEFVTASMPLNLFGIEEGSYEFQTAYLPLTSKYAALFTTSNEIIEFRELSIEETIDFNMMLLANDLWDTAVSRSERSLTAAVNKLQGLKNTLESTAD